MVAAYLLFCVGRGDILVDCILILLVGGGQVDDKPRRLANLELFVAEGERECGTWSSLLPLDNFILASIFIGFYRARK
jgi:hypothetical protein